MKGKSICVLLDTIEDMNYIETINPNWVTDNNVYIVCSRGHGDGYVDTFDPVKYPNVISGRKLFKEDFLTWNLMFKSIHPTMLIIIQTITTSLSRSVKNF